MTAGRFRSLAIWLGIVIACGAILIRTPIAVDLAAFLPRSPSAEERVLVNQLSNGAVSRIILIALEGAPAPELAAASRALARSLDTSPEILDVRNGPQESAADRDYLWRNRYLLSPGVTSEAFSQEHLRKALEADLDLLGSSAGLLAKGLLAADPTGEMLRLLSLLAPQAATTKVRNGVWFSGTGERALLVVEIRARSSDIDAQEAALDAIRAAFDEAKGAAGKTSAMRLVMTGPAVFSVNTRNRIEKDVWKLSLAAVAAISLVLLLARPTPLFLILALLPAATATLAGAAAVSVAFGSIAGTTLGFGATLMGEAVDYAVYLMMQTPGGVSPRLTLRRIGPVLRLGVLTSVFGFSPLLLSRFPGLAELGVFSIIGLVVAYAVTTWLLPDLLPRASTAQRKSSLFVSLIGARRWIWRLRPVAIGLIATGACVVVFHSGHLWDDSLSALSPLPQHEIELDEKLRRELGAPDVSDIVVVEAADQEQALQRSEEASVLLRRAAAEGILAGFSAPSLFLPSLETQSERQQALPDRKTLRDAFDRALAGLPFRPALFEPFLDDVEGAKTQAALTRQHLEGTALALQVDALLVQDSERWTAYLPLREVTDRQRLAEVIRGGTSDALLLNLKDGADGLFSNYRKEATVQSLIGGLALFVLLALHLRTPGRIARILFPLIAAVVTTTALILALGSRLTMFNLVGLLLVVGVGSNYCLFLERWESEDGRDETVVSLFVACLCTVAGFGTLALSSIPVLYEIGITVAVGATLSLIFAIAFAPRGGAPGQSPATGSETG